jgi:hypothetical protein
MRLRPIDPPPQAGSGSGSAAVKCRKPLSQACRRRVARYQMPVFSTSGHVNLVSRSLTEPLLERRRGHAAAYRTGYPARPSATPTSAPPCPTCCAGGCASPSARHRSTTPPPCYTRDRPPKRSSMPPPSTQRNDEAEHPLISVTTGTYVDVIERVQRAAVAGMDSLLSPAK